MKSDTTFEVTKEWLESFSIEEGTADCSAGVLSLADLIHFAESDSDEMVEFDGQADLSPLANSSVPVWELTPVAAAESR